MLVLPGILSGVPMFLLFFTESGRGVGVCEGKKLAQKAHGGKGDAKGVLRSDVVELT